MALLYGYTREGNKISIADYDRKLGVPVYCKFGKKLLAKKGINKQHHFSHADKDVEHPCTIKKKSKQQLLWQSLCPKENVEIVIDDILVDIYTNEELAIEFRPGSVNIEEIKKKESLEKMIWIFDSPNVIYDLGDFVILKRKPNLKVCRNPIFYDFGEYFGEVVFVDSGNHMWCKRISYGDFIKRFKIPILDEKLLNTTVESTTKKKIEITRYDVDNNPHKLSMKRVLNISEKKMSGDLLCKVFGEEGDVAFSKNCKMEWDPKEKVYKINAILYRYDDGNCAYEVEKREKGDFKIKNEKNEDIKNMIILNHLDFGWNISDNAKINLNSFLKTPRKDKYCFAYKVVSGVKQWRCYWENGDITFIGNIPN